MTTVRRHSSSGAGEGTGMSEKKYVQLIEQYREQMVEDLQALVRIKSVDELGIDGRG